MELCLHHFGVACRNVNNAIATYEAGFGMEVLGRWSTSDERDIAFVALGSDVIIELIGPPYRPFGERHVSRQGATFSHLGFLTTDLEETLLWVQSHGLSIMWGPADLVGFRHFGFQDPQGILIEIFEKKDSDMISKPALGGAVRLHHISMVVPDLRRAEDFYRRIFSLKTVVEHTQNNGGFLFMIDSKFTHEKHNFMIELIGPPTSNIDLSTALLEPREESMLKRHGACLDHICLVAEDVVAAHKSAVENGVTAETEPYRDYGSWISWVKDSEGNDVEYLTPVPREVVDVARSMGKPTQTAGVQFDAGTEYHGEELDPPWRQEQENKVGRQETKRS